MGWQDELRLNNAHRQSNDHNVTNHREEIGHSAFDQNQGQKGGYGGEYAEDDRYADLPGAIDGSLYWVFAHLFVRIHSFANNNGVIYQYAEDQNKGHHGHCGYGDIGVREHAYGTEKCDRYSYSHPHSELELQE